MIVKYPRNLNDNDLSFCEDTFTFPLNVPTQMSCFLQRIRLAEVVRAVIDARPPGQPDLDITEYHDVLALDRLFEQAISDLPPYLKVGAPIPPGAPRHLDLQRSIIHLGFYSRRARLHRSFLLQGYNQEQYQQSIKTCLSSAQTVISIAAGLLRRSLGMSTNGADSPSSEPPSTMSPAYHRLGAVINHMFLACTILALNAGLQSKAPLAPGATTSPTDTNSHPDLAQACRLLSAAGRESPVAAGLVRGLVGVLRQYHVKGIENVADEEHRADMLGREAELSRIDDATSILVREEDQVPPDVSGDKVPPDVSGDTDDLGLDELWSDIMSTMPITDSWDQVFAQLDTFCAAT